jgi:hypothetical protein
MRALTASLLLLCLTGCYRTKIINGTEPGRIPVQYEQRWHHTFLLGVVEVGGDYMLDEICPEGWSSVETRTTFLNSVAQVAAAGAGYNPQTLQVRCAQPTK